MTGRQRTRRLQGYLFRLKIIVTMMAIIMKMMTIIVTMMTIILVMMVIIMKMVTIFLTTMVDLNESEGHGDQAETEVGHGEIGDEHVPKRNNKH